MKLDEPIAVAVSGGMDSLMALCLLKEQGYEIMAVHGHFLPPEPQWETVCTGLEKACSILDIPFHALDVHKEFERCVVDPFVEGYKNGLTPNPCARCNPEVKFGILLDQALELGARSICTGHYVRMEERSDWGRVLVRGADRRKDQSYFLSLVPKDRIRMACFPLAGTFKKDVPAYLASHGLVPPIPGESQEICFVPDDDYQRFLQNKATLSGPGPVLLADGREVGHHEGLWRYTQGQRRGLGIAWHEALYVLDKDIPNNTLIVGVRDELAAFGCIVREMNYMVPPQEWPEVVMVQTRYRQKAKPSHFEVCGDELKLSFIESHTRPTPGQIAAIYTEDDEIVLGGGTIFSPL